MLGGTVAACGSSSESETEVLEKLVAEERAALDQYYGQSDPTPYVELFADKVTYFDAWSNGKLEDAAAKEYLAGFAGQIPPFGYELKNPRVDLYGEIAIFTYNIDVIDTTTSEIFVVWNVSAVRHRVGDTWELVHGHFSFAQAPAEDIPPPTGG